MYTVVSFEDQRCRQAVQLHWLVVMLQHVQTNYYYC